MGGGGAAEGGGEAKGVRCCCMLHTNPKPQTPNPKPQTPTCRLAGAAVQAVRVDHNVERSAVHDVCREFLEGGVELRVWGLGVGVWGLGFRV